MSPSAHSTQAVRSLGQQMLEVQMVLLPPRNELKMGADYEAFLCPVLQLHLVCVVGARAQRLRHTSSPPHYSSS